MKNALINLGTGAIFTGTLVFLYRVDQRSCAELARHEEYMRSFNSQPPEL